MLPRSLKHVYFIGIGGYGMSALAQVLLHSGLQVSGADLKESEITNHLVRQGIRVYYGHRPENVAGCQLVIYSTAIPEGNPEMAEARRRGIPLWHRSRLLAALMADHYSIAVAGTHGKTTTAALLSLILEEAGLDPTAIIGGIISTYQGNARRGEGSYLVAEACESDHSFLLYRPQIALVTGAEPDHLENYGGDFNLLFQAYQTFINNADGWAVLSGDDPRLGQMIAEGIGPKVFPYGVNNREADLYGGDITPAGLGSCFTLYRGQKPVTRARLNIPGRHNVSNALGALAVADRLGLDLKDCARSLSRFSGAGRRFEIVGRVNGMTIVSDYAHHPTEVQATIQAARTNGERVFCIFQPHRYTRTAYFMEDFARAFQGADLVLLHRIYPAGEKPIAGITSEKLARLLRQTQGSPVYAREDMGELEELALELVRPGDNILVMGAGDIDRLAHSLYERLKIKE